MLIVQTCISENLDAAIRHVPKDQHTHIYDNTRTFALDMVIALEQTYREQIQKSGTIYFGDTCEDVIAKRNLIAGDHTESVVISCASERTCPTVTKHKLEAWMMKEVDERFKKKSLIHWIY